MKKLIAIILFVSFPSLAQWKNVNSPVPRPESFLYFHNKIFVGSSTGIFISTDNGERWTLNDLGGSVTTIVAKGDTLIAGVSLKGIYFSYDHGNTWVNKSNGLLNLTLLKVIHYKDVLIAASRYYIYRSYDNGDSWVQYSYGISSIGVVNSFIGVDNFIFAGTQTGCFRISVTDTVWKNLDYGILKNDNIISLYFYKDFIYLASNTIKRSNDFGDYWETVGWDSMQYGLSSYTSFTSLGDNLFLGSGDGLFVSKGLSSEWELVTNSFRPVRILGKVENLLFLNVHNAFGIYISADTGKTFSRIATPEAVSTIFHESNSLFVGTPWGVSKSTDSGVNWKVEHYDSVIQIKPNIVKIGQYWFVPSNKGILRSTDTLKTFQTKNQGLTNFSSAYLISHQNTLYCNINSKIYESTNHGDSWSLLVGNLPNHLMSEMKIFNDTLIIGSNIGLILYSLDGKTFITRNKGLTDSTINSIHYTNSNLFVGTNKGLYSSPDFGVTWERIDTGFVDTRIAVINSIQGDLFVGAYGFNLYKSNDDGKTWVSVNDGLPSRSDAARFLYEFDNYIFFVGQDGRLWRREKNEMTDIQKVNAMIPTENMLHQNFPNPFNPNTTIKYQISKEGLVSLIIFDILGRKVETLINENKFPGFYSIEWNPKNFPTGVYYYTLQLGNQIETKKMLFLK